MSTTIPDRLFHYTPIYNAARIIQDGVINLATHGPAFLWVSRNPVYEKTACQPRCPLLLGPIGGRARFVFEGKAFQFVCYALGHPQETQGTRFPRRRQST
jgi:hypothetical protein